MHSATAENIIPSDRISVILAERAYGAPGDSAEAQTNFYHQKIPGTLLSIGEELRDKSVLLMLSIGDASRREVFDAYGQDLSLLNSRLLQFERCIKAAIQASIIRQAEGAQDRDAYKEHWERLSATIPSIGKGPLLDLGHERAALGVDELLSELQKEMEVGIERVLRRMALWLHLLVEADFVGLMEKTGSDVFRFHFFRHEHQRETVGEQTSDQRESHGPLEKVTTTTRKAVQHEQFLERHIHHVAEGADCALADYANKIPSRVRNFLRETPSWLRRHFRVIHGRMTKEEVLRQKTDQSKEIEVEVTSRWVRDPAICFDNFVFAGWSDTEQDRSGGFFSDQTAGAEAFRKKLKKAAAYTALVVFLGVVVALFAYSLHKRYEDGKVSARQEYVAQFEELTVHETKTGKGYLSLPGLQPLRYSGVNVHNHRMLTFVLGDTAKPKIEGQRVVGSGAKVERLVLPNGKDYGNIDLGPAFGIHVTLHVHEATEKFIRYSVTSYEE